MADSTYRFKKDNIKRLITAISKGATYVLACNYAGISYNTFISWMKKGERQLDNDEEGDDYLDFYCSVKKAEGVAVQGWLILIEEAAKNGNWQAAAWKLERRYPNEYGRFTAEKSPDDKEPRDDASDQERIDRVIAIVDEARKRNAVKRSRDDSSQENDSA
jgi:hypothetical protein